MTFYYRSLKSSKHPYKQTYIYIYVATVFASTGNPHQASPAYVSRLIGRQKLAEASNQIAAKLVTR